jgi:hypothetical protein
MSKKLSLEQLTEKIEKAQNRIAQIMVKEFDADELIADLVAADAVNQKLAPTRNQKLRAWWHRSQRTRKVLVRVISTVLGAILLICAILIGVHFIPSSYPRSYAVSDTWRATARDGIFDGSNKVDATGGRCFVTEADRAADCLNQGMIPAVNASLEEAVTKAREGKIWEGDNGNGEHWIIEHRDRQFKIIATK